MVENTAREKTTITQSKSIEDGIWTFGISLELTMTKDNDQLTRQECRPSVD